MRLDAELAVENARRRKASALSGVPAQRGAASNDGVAGHEPLRLVGIYGVGKRLFAEVRSAARAYVFLSGHSLPVGYRSAANDAYRLKMLAGACVTLERQGEETVLCLPSAGSQ